MSGAETGIGPMPPLRPIEDDGESEDIIDEEEPDQLPVDESDTPDDEPDDYVVPPKQGDEW
jgi:hypothetical protein